MEDREPTLSEIAYSIEALAQSTAKEFSSIHKSLDVVADDLCILKNDISDIKLSVRTLASSAGDHERRLGAIERSVGIGEE